jgi:NAD(P)-dependent dehydrogenase (short-subunit alcohol dehydrogenase family)
MEKTLSKKVAVVTGASSGIGREIALLLAENGAHVIASDINERADRKGFESRQEVSTAEAIVRAGGKAQYVGCDVTDPLQVARLVASAQEIFGGIDIMVNNAGIYRGGKLIHEMSEVDLEACWNINVRGTWFGSQEAVKAFLKQGRGGNIINIVSTAGLQGHPRQSVYNMSKGAVANLTRCLAIEYGKEGIRTNGICPTYAKTAMTRELFDDSEFEQTFTRMVPLGRWGEVRDVAELAVFLASEASSYIHGDLIRVDGGETLCRFSV